MKIDPRDSRALVPQEECEILKQIQNDHELIDRLNITSEELEALSKCALFGTMTCKQDMLFILQQIRAATAPAVGGPIDQTPLFPQPPPTADREEDPVPPDCRRLLIRLNGSPVPEPGSLAGVARKRVAERLAILAWTTLAVAVLGWSVLILILRWSNYFMTSVGMPASQAAPSTAWYSNLDQFKILFLVELLLVASIVVSMYLRSRRGSRRLKVRPRRSWR